jgi:hypothetical protein
MSSGYSVQSLATRMPIGFASGHCIKYQLVFKTALHDVYRLQFGFKSQRGFERQTTSFRLYVHAPTPKSSFLNELTPSQHMTCVSSYEIYS